MKPAAALLMLVLVGAAPPPVPVPASAAAPVLARVTLGDIRVQLFYRHSGTLSGNVAQPGRTHLWNTVVGEGDAKEPADDALVTVGLKGGQPDMVTDLPLIVTARAGGRVIASRSFSGILLPLQGQAWSALWLPNVTCRNRVTIDVSYGVQKKATFVNFDCGE